MDGSAIIEEIQGPYGPVRVPESLIQKIWLRGDFYREGLRTAGGQAVRVIEPGVWNLQEGPDFRGAVFDIGGARRHGDVEIHFYARDWRAHGHHEDPEFAHVALHVVLFPPEPGEPQTLLADGRAVPVAPLLACLNRDLEEYALDEALLASEKRDAVELVAPLMHMPVSERRALLRRKAAARWGQKRHRAREILAGAAWPEACHGGVMEALGYRRNRAPMLELARRYPLKNLTSGRMSAEALFAEQEGHWRLNGLRPANHPRKRLQQYLEVVGANPEWPRTCALLFNEAVTSGFEDTRSYRKQVKLTGLRHRLATAAFAEQVGGTRLDTVLCDHLLPLWAEQSGNGDVAFAHWFHWFAGDAPEVVGAFLRQSEIVDGKRWPLCSGWIQGALQLFLEGL